MKTKNQSLFRKVGISTDRGKVKACMICNKKFDFANKEHQCKRCKRAVCSNCSPTSGICFTEQGQLEKALHRQCKVCKEESESIKKFVDQYRVQFLQDTKSIEWLSQFGITKEQAKTEYQEAQSKIALSEQSEVRKLRNNLNVAFAEIPAVFNYSLREFIYYAIKDNEYEILKQTTSRILETFLSVYSDVGYSSDLIMLTIFFLCFASEPTAFSLLTIFFAEMVSANLYPMNILNYDNGEDIDRVLHVLNSSFKMTQNDQPLIKTFLKAKLLKYQQCFTINLLQFETSFYVIDQLYQLHQKAQEEFIKFIASAISQNIVDVKQNQLNLDEIEIILLRQVKQTMIQDGYFKTKKVVFQPTTKSMSRSQIQSRFLSVVQDATQSTMEFDRSTFLTKIVEEQKDQIVKLTEQLQSMQTGRKKTVQMKAKDQSYLQNDLKQLDNEDMVFQNLRKRTQHVIQAEEVDEDVAILSDYINKLEEVLILKHRLVKDQDVKILDYLNKNEQMSQEVFRLKKEIELQELKFLEQVKITAQFERDVNDCKRIIEDQKRKIKEQQENLIQSQTELNKSKVSLLELKAIEGSGFAVENFKLNQLQKECARLSEENAKYLKKIGELELINFEYSQKQGEQNEIKKLQIQIQQFEQQRFILTSQVNQRETTITQQQKQIEQLLAEASMKQEGEQLAQERRKNVEMQLQISNLQNQEKIWKQKYNDVERKLQEQQLMISELKQRSSGSQILTKDEQQRNYERMREQLQSELDAKNNLTKQLLLQVEDLSIKLNQEKQQNQNLQIDYDQLLEQTNVRQNRSQTIQQQAQQKDQRIQDFTSQIEQLQLEQSQIRTQYQQLSTRHSQLQDNFKKAELQIVELEHQKKMYERTIQEKVELVTQYETKMRELNSQKNSLDDQLNESLKKQSQQKVQLDSMLFQVGNKGREYESLKIKIEEQELIILGFKEKMNKVKENNEQDINEKNILETESGNLRKQLNMKEEQIKNKQEQINGLNDQIKNLNEKISFQEQQTLINNKQIKQLEESINQKEREYMSEVSKIISERDISRQRVIEAEAQILKLQQIEKKLKNDLQNSNEDIQQMLLTQEQLNKQLKDYESSSNSLRENSMETNKMNQIKLEKLEQQNQNMTIKIDSQSQEIKSYQQKIEQQLTLITELKFKVQEEESVRKAKEKQANDKISQISQLESQSIKLQEKFSTSNRQLEELQNQYDDLKKKYEIEQNSMQTLQSRSIEFNQLQQKFKEQSLKLSALEKQVIDYKEISDQNNKQKKELQSLTDLLDQKLATIVSHESKNIDLTNQLKESNYQLQQVRKENHEMMQKRAEDMQKMAQLKSIDVENGELKQLVYQHEATIQNQESLLTVLKNNQLNMEQSSMKLKLDFNHTEERLNDKITECEDKQRQITNLQNRLDQLNYKTQQLEETLRQVEDQRDDYQSKFELAEQQINLIKGKEKEFSQMVTGKIEQQEQIHALQKKLKTLERELQVSTNNIQSKEQDILQLQHVVTKKEQQITNLEEAVIKLKSDLSNTQRSYDTLKLELTEVNSEQTSSAELFVQVKQLTSDNLSKNAQITQLKSQINELQEKNKNLEKQYNKLRSDLLMGNQGFSDQSELKLRIEELELQLKQTQQQNKSKDNQIYELKLSSENQQISETNLRNSNQKQQEQPVVSSNDSQKQQDYLYIIQQQNEEIEQLKRNTMDSGQDLIELLTLIMSVFLKKKVKKGQLNIQMVQEQLKLFEKENKSLFIKEEDDDNLVLQKLQQYRGDYINFRFRVEQILSKVLVLKEQMIQVISEAKVQGKKKDANREMEAENLIMYIKLLLDSQTVSLNNQMAQCQQLEAELRSYKNGTSPQGQIIQQVKELVSKAPYLTQQQIYQFTEPKVQIKLRKDQDQEDARLLLEARNHQITWLKGLINEKQDQLAMMNTYISNLKELIDKYHLK